MNSLNNSILNIHTIETFHKSGKGHSFGLYISDEELNHVLNNLLDNTFAPYSLIVFKWDGNSSFTGNEYPVEEFMNLRKEGFYSFFLKSTILSPDFVLENVVMQKAELNSLQKLLYYKGIIKIMHGLLMSHKYFAGSDFTMIPEYHRISDPRTSFKNKEYEQIYLAMKKQIKKLMCYKSVTVQDGKVSSQKEVSQGYADLLLSGQIESLISFKKE